MRVLVFFLLIFGPHAATAAEKLYRALDVFSNGRAHGKLQLKFKYIKDQCNDFGLKGEFKPLTFKGEKYLLADFAVVSTQKFCGTPADSKIDLKNSNHTPAFLMSSPFKLTFPRDGKVTVLVPTDAELVNLD